jgi:hypothetical protein
MAVQGTQITVTTAPTVIAGNGSHGNIRVIVRNRGTGTAYLGGSTVVVRGKCYFHARHADVGEINSAQRNSVRRHLRPLRDCGELKRRSTAQKQRRDSEAWRQRRSGLLRPGCPLGRLKERRR